RCLFAEMEFLDWLIDGCYRLFDRFELFCPYAMYYFAGAVRSEDRRRSGQNDDAGFLSSLHPPFREALKRCHTWLQSATDLGPASELYGRVSHDIATFNRAGFCDPHKQNLYPFV